VLVVEDAVNAQPAELFVGMTLTCTSPSGKSRVVETGRTVWPDAASFAIPMAFTFVADSTGTYECQTDVMMCNPGNCTSPTGSGRLRIPRVGSCRYPSSETSSSVSPVSPVTPVTRPELANARTEPFSSGPWKAWGDGTRPLRRARGAVDCAWA